MSLLGQIPALADVEPVRSLRIPARLDYTFTAGEATSRFLKGIKEKRILGERCPVCQKVYVPPRGACPEDGVPTAEQVELPHTGIVTTFCVVNLDFTEERGRGADRYGHGTHIAGIVAARELGRGAGGDSGMAPGAHLLNLKALKADGSGKVSDVIDAIDWAIDNRWRYGILRLCGAQASVTLDGREIAAYEEFNSRGRRDGPYNNGSYRIEMDR